VWPFVSLVVVVSVLGVGPVRLADHDQLTHIFI
jgi:hypothetical protein